MPPPRKLKMSNFRLHTSNRLEKLAGALAESVRRPLRSPLAAETILVQSQEMARWLKLELAQRHGICSNARFPFPRAFSHEIFRTVLGDLPAKAIYDPDLLLWELMGKLPKFLDQPGFEPVKNYLGAEPDDRKRYQLADRIANVFDQYLLFRPDLIRQWEGGADQSWQAELWREVSIPFHGQHPAALQARLIEHLERQVGSIVDLPERVAIFGVSALPPFYLRIFAALARHIEVSLYLLQPCEEFWGYISSVREQEKILKRAGRGAADAGQFHLETGNRLLASMGQMGRDFVLLLQDAGDWQESEPSLFTAPGAGSVLSIIQADILSLKDSLPGETPEAKITEQDDSLQVHSCHSPLRELEVLYDHLLDWFERDPQLSPRDVLVMIPDIELYAPFIQAVFGSPEQDSLRIPFSVADRTARTQSQLADTFLALLQLADSRLGASQVLALLESAPVRRKFDLDEAELELVRRWVEEVRIRWGEDEQQRAGLGLPSWPENTWRHGLERLLAGYAMADGGEELFGDILPYTDIEGGPGEILGRFVEFIEQLFAALKELRTARRLDEWAETFRLILRKLFAVGDAEVPELQLLNAGFEKLTDAVVRAGFDQPVSLAVVLEQLNRDLARVDFGSGYLTGSVTFCALKPMRSIPAKVICLLGMNDRSFPRTSSPLSFDLMAQQPRLGDRSSRADDRYLFLETLISARARLYLSYVGQSIKDNREAPPSVVVSELMDYVAQRFELPGRDLVKDHILTRHRLQAFSPAYFQGGKYFSYSRENLKASQVIAPERKPPGSFIPRLLPEPEPEWRRVRLESLAAFFANPAKFLAEKRLGLRLPDDATATEEREAFAIAGLDRYKLEQELLDLIMGGTRLKDSVELVRASGRLPAGIAGDVHFAQIRRDVEVFRQRLQPFLPDKFLPHAPCELAVGDFVLSGSIRHATPAGGLLSYRLAKIKPKDLLRAWLEHLLFHAAGTGNNAKESIIVGSDSISQLAPVSEPLPVLEKLLDLYWAGLRQPVKFFPESSFAFAVADFKLKIGGKTTRSPLAQAEENWSGDEYKKTGERTDKYFSLFFNDENVLDEDFETVARAVFCPLLENLSEVGE